MGNSPSKERSKSHSHPSSLRHADGSHVQPETPGSTSQQASPADRLAGQLYASRGAVIRSNRPDLSFLTLARDRGNNDDQTPERPRETKVEREARRAERDRLAREKERERSLREEAVDGGFLVTLGTYTGPEDFSKSVVRQLQIERRLAPFWRGLNDHSDSWTEAQLVAAARGLPIPAADEVPPEMARSVSQASQNPSRSDINVSGLTVPIMARSESAQSETNLSASHPAFSNSGSGSPMTSTSASALFRGRAKTLASLATGSKSQSPDMTPQEIQLPKDPYVNGLPLEAYLYREPLECPICFLYYPPYLNKTRCCDQPICSECFVQIKRPDPHPPEHEQPGQQRPPEEEAEMLVSEVAACPFCVTPEFGVTYDAPPFKRGLAYASHNGHPLSSLRNPTSAMSSSTSLTSTANRRRATSLSATAPQVITTDKVRPDWAKKLADARAHAMRRSVAATALHNAAYVLGNNGDSQYRGGIGFGRRRRMFDASPGGSGSGTPREDGNADTPSRSGRRTRVDDIEELMMMEAIRLSLAAEEDRKRREEKEARKDEKKKAKEAKKEAKQAEKHARRHGSGNSGLYPVGTNDSTSTWGSVGMSRSMSNLGTQPAIPEEQMGGKGKAPVQTPSSATQQVDTTTVSSIPATTSAVEDPQRHLEASRANINPLPTQPISMPNARSNHFRQLSEASSVASSFGDSAPGSYLAGVDTNPPSARGSHVDVSATNNSAQTGNESMFNFRSLAAMIDREGEKTRGEGEHVEHMTSEAASAEASASPAAENPAKVDDNLLTPEPPKAVNDSAAARSRGNSGESSSSAPPLANSEHTPSSSQSTSSGVDENITNDVANHDPSKNDLRAPAAPIKSVNDVVDSKEHGNANVLDHAHAHEATQ